MPLTCDCTIRYHLKISDTWHSLCYCEWFFMMLMSIGFGNDEHAHEMLLREVEVNMYTSFFKSALFMHLVSSLILTNFDDLSLSVRDITTVYCSKSEVRPCFPNHGLDGRIFYILSSPCRYIRRFREKGPTLKSYQH